jgi:predicted component of type VI protein secretion system
LELERLVQGRPEQQMGRAVLPGQEPDWDAVARICDYYQRHEPSSPVPLLLRRCKRLVSASFLEIVCDIAPDGVSQVEMWRGKEEQSGTDNREATGPLHNSGRRTT